VQVNALNGTIIAQQATIKALQAQVSERVITTVGPLVSLHNQRKQGLTVTQMPQQALKFSVSSLCIGIPNTAYLQNIPIFPE
jgi:hypothetical protein